MLNTFSIPLWYRGYQGVFSLSGWWQILHDQTRSLWVFGTWLAKKQPKSSAFQVFKRGDSLWDLCFALGGFFSMKTFCGYDFYSLRHELRTISVSISHIKYRITPHPIWSNCRMLQASFSLAGPHQFCKTSWYQADPTEIL